MTKKNKLKIILPIVVSALVVLLTVLLIVLLPNEISQNTYFNSLSNSNFTKQVQYTTITENQIIVYEKLETIIFDNKKVYHKIEEKRLSSNPNTLYEEVLTEYYYSKDKIYYFEDNIWKTNDFNLKDNLKTYSLKTDYFTTLEFDKDFKEIGILSGNIKDENVNNVLNSETNFNNASLIIKLNKKFKITDCSITAKTATNRDVLITNTFTYNQEAVILPNI